MPLNSVNNSICVRVGDKWLTRVKAVQQCSWGCPVTATTGVRVLGKDERTQVQGAHTAPHQMVNESFPDCRPLSPWCWVGLTVCQHSHTQPRGHCDTEDGPFMVTYLHEHAESGFKEISKAWGCMFNVNGIWLLRIKYFLHNLLQQWFVGCLERQNIELWAKAFFFLYLETVLPASKKLKWVQFDTEQWLWFFCVQGYKTTLSL